VRPDAEVLIAESGIAMSSSDLPSAATPRATAMTPPMIMTADLNPPLTCELVLPPGSNPKLASGVPEGRGNAQECGDPV
jgi:hypothetical protein